MNLAHAESLTARQRLGRSASMLLIGAMVLLALAGPRGLLAWREYSAQLGAHQAQIKVLEEERDAIRNRVALVDPRHVDPDLAGELLRSDLNVVHPDEVVLPLD